MKNNWLDRSLLEIGHYTLCTTEKQFKKTLDHLNIPFEERPPYLLTKQANATVHHFDCDGKQCHIVCLGSFERVTTAQVIALLVHESVHLWQEFREFIGERQPGRETEAYAIQRISQSLITEFLRQKKRSKK